MASNLFDSIINGVKEQFIPKFAKSATNINPHHRISLPRLRHFKKKGPIRLKLPDNLYSQKNLADQKACVANYHERQRDNHKQRQLKNQADKINRSFMIQQRREFKASKPEFVED